MSLYSRLVDFVLAYVHCTLCARSVRVHFAFPDRLKQLILLGHFLTYRRLAVLSRSYYNCLTYLVKLVLIH
jgi:hypothetical protein